MMRAWFLFSFIFPLLLSILDGVTVWVQPGYEKLPSRLNRWSLIWRIVNYDKWVNIWHEETILYYRAEGEYPREDNLEEIQTLWEMSSAPWIEVFCLATPELVSSHWASNWHPLVFRCGSKSAISSVDVQWACFELGILWVQAGCMWRVGACRRCGSVVWTIWPQALHRSLQREPGCWWLGRKPSETGFHVESGIERLSLGRDCKVAEELCSGPTTDAELHWVWVSSLPHWRFCCSRKLRGPFLLPFQCPLLRKLSVVLTLKERCLKEFLFCF